MKIIMLILSMVIATQLFAVDLPDRLVGQYQTDPGTCGVNHPDVFIANDGTKLTIASSTQEGTWVINEEIRLGTQGKKYDCSPTGKWSNPIECMVEETENSITLNERSCVLICGQWGVAIGLTELDEGHVAIETALTQGRSCLLTKIVK
ncbi:MAG: hypothetical protein WC635_11520 [Bacteriovorax sp.]